MGGQGGGDHVAVLADQDDGAEPVVDGGDQVLEPGALGQPAGDPDHRVVGLQGGLGRVRVGGLGVVDPGHAAGLGDDLDAVAVGPERLQPVAYGGLGDPVCAGQRGRGERVLDVVGRGGGEIGDLAQLRGGGLALLDEGAVDEDVLDDPDLTDGRGAEGEPDRAGALDDVGLLDQVHGGLVGDVVDARPLDAFVDAALVGGVLLHRGVPVEVVLGDVEDHGGLGGHRGGVVELEGGELDGEDVVGLGVHHGLDDRQADVADGDGPQASRTQDVVEHLHGRGLAVGAGDRQPGGGIVGVAQPPGELDLSPDRDPALARLREQRRRRSPTGRGDHDVDVVGQHVGGALAEAYVGTQDTEELGLLLALLVARGLVERDHRGTQVGEVVGGREPRDAEAGHDRLHALPGVVAAELVELFSHVVGLSHQMVATHSA